MELGRMEECDCEMQQGASQQGRWMIRRWWNTGTGCVDIYVSCCMVATFLDYRSVFHLSVFSFAAEW
ncbi:hypothetical protein LXL04_016339 [Taraxacum kok-saghyz]